MPGNLQGLGKQRILLREWFSLAYENRVLVVLIGNWGHFPRDDIRRLVRFARGIGLNLFVDIGDPVCEMPLDEIEVMLGDMAE
jgi:hypothetical protein